ncbi:MAG: hypothetical protein A2Z83_03625 [Omnitrophica bacterium GWA2_52_8]|nr:MAG: hypothetical protein A2Z83_03625 [Omnitrophica bacterium GWA2_52_8]
MIAWLSRNWLLKFIALCLAVGLWYYAVGEEDIEVTRTVPLELAVKNPQMSILKASTDMVQITLAAPRALLSELTSEEIRAAHEIGAEAKTAGDYSFRLEPREIIIPNVQIRVVSIQPEVIQVVLDELIAKKLRVEPDFAGEPALGYTVVQNEIQIDPTAILVEGPKSQLEKQESVKTDPIDLVGRIRSLRRTMSLRLPANLKPLTETMIDIYVPIHEEFEERFFDQVPLKIMAPVDGAHPIKIAQSSISFTLKGSKGQMEKLSAETMLAYIETAALEPGEHKVPVRLVLPEDVFLKEGTELTADIEVKK